MDEPHGIQGVRWSRTTLVLLATAAFGSACGGSVYYGQVPVPNTNQRLVVGHDSFPSKQMWVIENGKIQPVGIVFEERK